jgi:hypothetical protein
MAANNQNQPTIEHIMQINERMIDAFDRITERYERLNERYAWFLEQSHKFNDQIFNNLMYLSFGNEGPMANIDFTQSNNPPPVPARFNGNKSHNNGKKHNKKQRWAHEHKHDNIIPVPTNNRDYFNNTETINMQRRPNEPTGTSVKNVTSATSATNTTSATSTPTGGALKAGTPVTPYFNTNMPGGPLHKIQPLFTNLLPKKSNEQKTHDEKSTEQKPSVKPPKDNSDTES